MSHIQLSERGRDIRSFPDSMYPETWNDILRSGLLNEEELVSVPSPEARREIINACFPLPLDPERKLPCQAHIENFLHVIRREPLTFLRCDAATALASEVPLYRVHEAAAAGKTIQFTDADFAAESAAEPEPNNNPPTP